MDPAAPPWSRRLPMQLVLYRSKERRSVRARTLALRRPGSHKLGGVCPDSRCHWSRGLARPRKPGERVSRRRIEHLPRLNFRKDYSAAGGRVF
jgi:hypothetical protein